MIRDLPEKLRELRTKAGLSQREVARHLQSSTSIISAYETGERTPSIENLIALSYLYHCSTDYLLGKEPGPQENSVSVEGLRPEQVELLTELISTMRKVARE